MDNETRVLVDQYNNALSKRLYYKKKIEESKGNLKYNNKQEAYWSNKQKSTWEDIRIIENGR